MKWKLAAIVAGSMLAASAQAAFTADQVQSFTLANGMKFIVLESSTIPNANMYTFWKVGSRNEAPGTTGLSHFFEHMMFNGTKTRAPGEFDRVMEAAGVRVVRRTTEQAVFAFSASATPNASRLIRRFH